MELLRRAQQTDGHTFYEQLKEIAVHEMKSNPPEAAEWMDVLFFHSGKTPKKIANRFTAEYRDDSDWPVCKVEFKRSNKFRNELGERLNRADFTSKNGEALY